MAVDDVEDVDEESAVAPRGRRSSSRSSGPERDSEEEEEVVHIFSFSLLCFLSSTLFRIHLFSLRWYEDKRKSR